MPAETLQQRALICRWLSTLFIQKLDDETLQACLDGEAAPALELLAEHEPLAALTGRFNDALDALRQIEQPSLALAADFATLFLLDERGAAPPYASLYQSQGQGQTAMFHLKAAERMEVRLKAAGYRIDAPLREPADHLAIMLDYLATGWERIASTQESFARREMLQGLEQFVRGELAWLPRFNQRCESVDTVSDLYPCAAALVTQYRAALLEALRRDRQAAENARPAS
ncbi:MAG TPA: molecular chaperone TorD [Halomonas sp.]|nr:molecular chaperone TorD [Halomonas sp.]